MTFPWASDDKRRLRELYDSGISFLKIAETLGGGLTKSAVIAMAHRLGFPQRQKSSPPKTIVVKAAPPPRLPPIVEAVVSKDLPRTVAAAFDPGARKTVDLFSLRVGQCRWPFGQAPTRFCGVVTVDPTNPECPYCAEHTALARAARLVQQKEAA